MFAFTTYCISVGHFTPDLVFFFLLGLTEMFKINFNQFEKLMISFHCSNTHLLVHLFTFTIRGKHESYSR